MIDTMKWTVAAVAIVIVSAAACKEQQGTTVETNRDATAPQVNRTNTDVIDARRDPPPALSSQSARGTQTPPNSDDAAGSSTGTQHDSYQSSRDAYKAALAKAEDDHKTALESCNALAKAARKSCKDNADERLKIAKSEAARLKPAS